MRPKTKRRLTILIVATVAVVGLTALFFVVRLGQKEAERKQARVDGMAAFDQGDYVTALDRLSKYTYSDTGKADADAIYAQAVSRSMVALPGNRHLKTSIDWMNDYRKLRPGDAKGQKTLLELYSKANWSTEGLALADEILRSNPNDLEALNAKVKMLTRLRRPGEALAPAEKLVQLQPTDFDTQFQLYQTLIQLKKPAPEVLARAKADLAKHPDDPRFELLLALAMNYAGDGAGAHSLLLKAADRKAPDAAFVRAATRLLDSAREYARAQQVLERAAADLQDPVVLQMLVQRLWQSGQKDEVAKRLANVDIADPRTNTNLLALKAISLYETNQAAAAPGVVDALAQRTLDDEAYAWSRAIPARYSEPDARKAIEVLQDAANRDRDNAILKLWLGDAYGKLREEELAIAFWRQAAALAPAWTEPSIKQARALALSRRGNEAYQAAEQALMRDPTSIDVAVSVAMALSARNDSEPGSVSQKSILDAVELIQKKQPNEPQTLPMFVTLLVRSNQRDRALATIQGALSANPKLPADTLLRLANVSEQLELNQEQAIYDAMLAAGMESPQLAFAQARRQHTAGKSAEGLTQLRQRAAAAKSDQSAWETAVAQYLDLIKSDEAAKAWKTLVEKHAGDVDTQLAFLRSPARLTDRATWAATIDRLKQATRDEAVGWRLERARFLLTPNGDVQPGDRDRADAITLLNELVRLQPDLLEPRFMLAEAHVKTNNSAAAIEQLKNVISLRPNDPQVLLMLTRQLIDSGKTTEAQTYLSQLRDTGQLSTTGLRMIAQMQSDLGQMDEAAQTLARIPAGDPQRDLQMAQLYRRRGDNKQAGELFDSLAAAADITPDAIAAAARFYRSTAQKEKADAVLARLNEAAPSGATAELIRAGLAERFETAEVAEPLYQAAADKEPAARRELAGFYLRWGKFDQAKSALAAAPRSDDTAALAKVIDLAASLPANVNARDLTVLLSRSPANASAVDLLTALRDSGKDDPDARIQRLRSVADTHPRFWPAREQLIRAMIAAGRLDRAREQAQNALTQFPVEPEPAQLLCGIHKAMNQPAAALSVAQQWRQRTLDNPRFADIAAAEALIDLNRNREALATLQPYLEVARRDPMNQLDVIWPWGRASLRENRVEEVASVYQPLLAGNAAARALWLAMAGDVGPDAAAAGSWISRVAPMMDATKSADQNALARAWFVVGQRYRDKTAYARAAALLKPLADANPKDLQTLSLLAESQREVGDWVGTEATLRAAIAAGDEGYSGNTLAFLMLTQNKGLEEALAMSDKAVASSPRSAGYLDTRGQIKLRLGQYDAAIEDFNRALGLQSDLVDSLIGKAEALARAGKKAEARNLLPTIDALQQRQPLSEFSRKQLETLRGLL